MQHQHASHTAQHTCCCGFAGSSAMSPYSRAIMSSSAILYPLTLFRLGEQVPVLGSATSARATSIQGTVPISRKLCKLSKNTLDR